FYSTNVVLLNSMNVTGSFAMAGGTFAVQAGPSLPALTVGGALSQTGGKLDLSQGGLVLAATAGSVSASFYDARAASATFGGALPSTVTFSGFLEIGDGATLTAGDTLFLSSGQLGFDNDNSFLGAGAVNSSTSAVVA